jgi:hypothetical protein
VFYPIVFSTYLHFKSDILVWKSWVWRKPTSATSQNIAQNMQVDTIYTAGLAISYVYLLIYKRIRARESFIFSKTSTRALGTTQPSNSVGTVALSSRVKRSGRETDHSPLSSAEVKNGWCYTSIPPACLHGVHKGKFIYTPFNDATSNSRLHTRINE